MRHYCRAFLCAVLLCGIVGEPARAAQVPPVTMSRDGAGQTTVQAVRVAEPMHVDGELTETGCSAFSLGVCAFTV